MEDIVSSMEANLRWVLLTAVAPVSWGTTYFVTHQLLPADHPLYGAVIRALPAGLLLLLVRRRLPRGSWWWRSLVLGTLSMGVFFALVYLAAQLLPTSIAATVMATSPVAMMASAWLLLSVRPAGRHLVGAGAGILGVWLMLATATTGVDPLGVLASVAAMAMSSFGYVLATRWGVGVDVVSTTAWQLVAGGVVLLPVAVVVEGAPPSLDLPALLGFGYVTVVATALAFLAWFAGLRHLGPGTVGLVGLLNPVTGVLLGTVVAAEALTTQQLGGMALVLGGILLGRPAGSGRVRRRARLRLRRRLPATEHAVPVGVRRVDRDAQREPGREAQPREHGEVGHQPQARHTGHDRQGRRPGDPEPPGQVGPDPAQDRDAEAHQHEGRERADVDHLLEQLDPGEAGDECDHHTGPHLQPHRGPEPPRRA